MPGTLFVVATPIGNLEDLSFRALRTLREVDLIAAEDTRRTSKLLAHYEIRKSMVSLHEHNEHREAPRLAARLERGESIALVTDAGTPGISDPGAHLVRLARERHVPVSPIPGPSAVMAALSVSGFPADRFAFLGFPPRSGSARRDWLARAKKESSVLVLFEAPHRIRQTLSDLTDIFIDRPIQVHRELSKINEELVIYTNKETSQKVKELGEFVVVVDEAAKADDRSQDDQLLDRAILMFGCMTTSSVFTSVEAVALTAKAFDIDEQVVRKAVKKHKIAENQRRQSLP
ncbi:MAG TPA: 16S rRNA (cytidine(1402)-2'-O)-methyltransferase [Vicinamibacterales bacterium]|nr:16S rRNA (cytidine(1402)-2'-O)-methyltransferase [Vicinamibacterales bacterium]